MTFSICVREETDEGTSFGVAVATDAPAVGALAPYVTHDGVISTQSFVNVRLGRRGVALLPDLGVDDALAGLLEQDDHSHLRQVHGLDARGNAFAHSGDGCDGWFGHRVHDEKDLTVAGNMLVGEETLDALAETFAAGNEEENEEEGLVSRLIDALAAGKEAGGDKRGHTSAAVMVKAPRTTAYHDLRVDAHKEPIAELRRVYETTKAASDGFSESSKERIFD
ncbi:hypothetical protein ZOD2009_03797 [Haladaptatus paucihalophilus DX253]|uniref:Uncharacterized conserved protein, Ntn-hydrolase superfamily n=1 Tax=Haladaptatus paucihalophilus DX253 TaxID=797209 RepID=E7QPM1_HALPU|nr:DUF1028 domain-containing protein [Haladaptatus paucihalophilus]EFW93504.1 hypothetical protein ZOD2009_03797 [Haladaptatus paucihalophilus DX253]SHL20903.1 Uncharacterized conserved protein, Ntn-hydrolase superfamily [Haladaptatus paucihalophilus DX253]